MTLAETLEGVGDQIKALRNEDDPGAFTHYHISVTSDRGELVISTGWTEATITVPVVNEQWGLVEVLYTYEMNNPGDIVAMTVRPFGNHNIQDWQLVAETINEQIA